MIWTRARTAGSLCRLAIGLAMAAAVLVVAVPAVADRLQPPPGPSAQLPDLDPAVPNQLLLQRGGRAKRRVYRLGFQSATGNVGGGPLIIDGRRANRATQKMVTDQVILRGAEPPQVVPGVGSLTYVTSVDHQHWHLLRFMRYELRRAGSGHAVVRDRKSGFCLGDRYPLTSPDLPARAPQKVYTSRCGLHQPGLLSIREGISVGYGDHYPAFLEGQSLPLTGLRSGRYVLVHRVNTNRRLQELSYDNNASSILLDLRWRHRVPLLRVLASCADTDRCDLAS